MERHIRGTATGSGAATAAAKAGVEDSTNKTLERWKSDAYQVYIEIPRHHLTAVSVQLAATQEMCPRTDCKHYRHTGDMGITQVDM